MTISASLRLRLWSDRLRVGEFKMFARLAIAVLAVVISNPVAAMQDGDRYRMAEAQAMQLMPKGSVVVAICGPHIGSAHYVNGKGWAPDPITGGTVVIGKLPDGGMDVLWRDATGIFYSATRAGALVRTTHVAESGEFMLLVIHEGGAVVETHNILFAETGIVDQWTTNRRAEGELAPLSKVAAYRSQCG